ncbi:MAG: hypothetical protein V7731_15550 [Amphritea sp.]
MNRKISNTSALSLVIVGILLSAGTTTVRATEPCGDFGECKVLIEINSTDGDIGFHFLMDGDDLNSARLHNPNGAKVFEDEAKGPLREQKLTETFAESAEPPCFEQEPEPGEEAEEFVTLIEFLERWAAGTYVFTGKSDGGEKAEGTTTLSYKLPAAPKMLAFDGSMISWEEGDDLGQCATKSELDDLVSDSTLPMHPMDVDVVAWEVVFEPEDGSNLKFSIRVPTTAMSVTVPMDYLLSLGDNTPAKIEVGAIGADDNATFSEIGDICVNEVEEGCIDD